MGQKFDDVRPVNLAGTQFFPVSSVEVLEYHEEDDGKGRPTQLLLWLKIEGAEDTPFAVRFHSPGPVDELIVALITHRRGVWGTGGQVYGVD